MKTLEYYRDREALVEQVRGDIDVYGLGQEVIVSYAYETFSRVVVQYVCDYVLATAPSVEQVALAGYENGNLQYVLESWEEDLAAILKTKHGKMTLGNLLKSLPKF